MPKHDIGELITKLNDAVNKLNNLRIKYDDLEKENARLREAMEMARDCLEDKDVIGAKQTLTLALGETQ
jgi:hypothetical protein